MAWERETQARFSSWLSLLAQWQAVTARLAQHSSQPPHPSVPGALGSPLEKSRGLLENAD